MLQSQRLRLGAKMHQHFDEENEFAFDCIKQTAKWVNIMMVALAAH